MFATQLLNFLMSSHKYNYSKLSDTVYVAKNRVTTISQGDITFLSNRALELPEKKVRILLHGEPKQLLHEMLIAHTKGSYIQPHINECSVKSFVVLSGTMVLVLYRKDGTIDEIVRLSASEYETDIMIRLNTPFYHTVLVLTETVVFLETILGPHNSTCYAEFAPRPEEQELADNYLAWLTKEVGIEE